MSCPKLKNWEHKNSMKKKKENGHLVLMAMVYLKGNLNWVPNSFMSPMIYFNVSTKILLIFLVGK
jgi:hypothetical protein